MSNIENSVTSGSYHSVAKAVVGCPELVEFAPVLGDPVKTEFDSRRPELYALLAIVVDKVFTDALADKDDKPPFGLVDDSGSPVVQLAGMYELGVGIGHTLRQQTKPSFEAMKGSHLAPALERLEELTGLFHQSFEGSRYETTERLVNSGVGTAAQEIGAALGAVNRMAMLQNPEATNDQVTPIARNSYPLIRRIAAASLTHLTSVGFVVSEAGRTYGPGYEIHTRGLAIKTNHNKEQYVDFVRPVLMTPDPYAGKSGRTIGQTKRPTYETLGCPALVKFNGQSVIDGLWDWAVDAADAAKLFGNRSAA